MKTFGPKQQRAAYTIKTPSKPAKILIVDSDARCRAHLQEKLTAGLECVVKLAEDEIEGLRLAIGWFPHIILLNPEPEQRHSLLEGIKSSLDLQPPYVILTSSEAIIREFGQQHTDKIDDYLTLPCHPVELLARVRSGLRIRELEHRVSTNTRYLQQLALIDPTTGILNASALDQLLEKEKNKSEVEAKPLTLLLSTIEIQDETWQPKPGWENCEEVLRAVADVLGDNLRTCDFVAECDPGRFVIVLPGTPEEQAEQVAKRLANMVQQIQLESSTTRATLVVRFHKYPVRLGTTDQNIFHIG